MYDSRVSSCLYENIRTDKKILRMTGHSKCFALLCLRTQNTRTHGIKLTTNQDTRSDISWIEYLGQDKLMAAYSISYQYGTNIIYRHR